MPQGVYFNFVYSLKHCPRKLDSVFLLTLGFLCVKVKQDLREAGANPARARRRKALKGKTVYLRRRG